MMNHAETLFTSGCNCAQSVFMACTADLGIDQDTALQLTAPFGGGMARLREVCGALTGLFMAVGLRYGSTDPNDHTAKTQLYERIQALAGQFRQEYGSLLCRDLLQMSEQTSTATPEIRTAEYYARRPCVEYVRFAAGLMEQLAKERETRSIARDKPDHQAAKEK
jgi:C_GCAxxG_C_C family probable redox protein